MGVGSVVVGAPLALAGEGGLGFGVFQDVQAGLAAAEMEQPALTGMSYARPAAWEVGAHLLALGSFLAGAGVMQQLVPGTILLGSDDGRSVSRLDHLKEQGTTNLLLAIAPIGAGVVIAGAGAGLGVYAWMAPPPAEAP